MAFLVIELNAVYCSAVYGLESVLLSEVCVYACARVFVWMRVVQTHRNEWNRAREESVQRENG